MLASTTWAKENFAPAGQPSFRAFFAFYPYCNTIFPERDRVSAPVRIHTGAADDWTPAKPCADLAGSLKAAGQDVSISVYPDAYHSFDQARDTVFLPNVVNPADCYAKMPSILGPLAPESIANCVKKGATVGNSPSATEQAREESACADGGVAEIEGWIVNDGFWPVAGIDADSTGASAACPTAVGRASRAAPNRGAASRDRSHSSLDDPK